MNRLDQIILKLDLKPHPEGGFFKETYRSEGVINSESLNPDYEGERSYSTCIYFLLTSEDFSAFHCIRQDEIWHFYDGSPICLHVITEDGAYSKTVVGKDIGQGQFPQIVVKGGSWFAADVKNSEDYSLIGCTVSPGFDFRDFQLAQCSDLISKFPQHREIITKLTR
jgi:predicted cupin superfamily sugar epimerase